MKLLLCDECSDVIKLTTHWRTCECGNVGGQYVDDLRAVVNGKGISLAFDSNTLVDAVRSFRAGAFVNGNQFVAWVRNHSGKGNENTTIGTKDDAERIAMVNRLGRKQ